MLVIIRIMVLSLKTLPHPLFAFKIILLVFDSENRYVNQIILASELFGN